MKTITRLLVLVGLFLPIAFSCPARGAQSSDGDGVPDVWKKSGSTTITLGDGTAQRLDLTKDGPLSVGQKDVFVWVAWMETRTHTHRPDTDAMKKIKAAFADAPIQNVNGKTGIRLHIFFNSQPIPEVSMLGTTDGNGNYNWTAFDALKKQYFPKELSNIFHFCMFAHDIDFAHHSGISKDIGGYDFIVSLGAFGVNGNVADVESQAGTFMHELGHNLSLRHGGGDDVNYKPNYVSIMNYFFQLTGVPENLVTGNFDYSRFSVDEDEENLDRKLGLKVSGTLARYGTQYFCSLHGSVTETADSIGGPIDWDCSGTKSGLTRGDTNLDGQIGLLRGYNDWEHVQFVYMRSTLGVAHLVRPLLKDELTVDEANRISIPPVPNVLAVGVSSGVLVSWKRIPLDRVVAYKVVRKSEGGSEQEIGITEGSGLLDKDPPKGNYSYYVRGLYTLFGKTGRSQLGFPTEQLERLIDDTGLIAAIRQQAPKGMDRLETMGLKPKAVRGLAPVALLVETSPSRGSSIQVQ
jgi:hypothetical protein